MSKDTRPFIFIDTCSLLDSCWNCVDRKADKFEYSQAKDDRFWGKEFPGLVAMGEVIIPKRNYEELVKHANNQKKPGLADRSKFILKRLDSLIADGKIQIVGDENDPFADAILLSVALKFRTQKNMAFITQDRKLAHDLESIRHFRSVEPRNGLDIKVRRITKDGSLGKHGQNSARDKINVPPNREKRNIEESSSNKNWWDS